MNARIARNQHGFTLTELLVACAMIGVVMLGLFSLLRSGQQSYLVGTNQVEAQQALRLALARMSNEIREAGYCPTCGTGSPAIAAFPAITGPTSGTAPTSTGFTIQNDWSSNWNGTSGIATSGTVNQVVMSSTSNSTSNVTRGEQIIYSYSSGTLTRREIGIDNTAVTVASNLASLSFTYLDASGTAFTPTTGTQGNIRTVVVNVVGQPQVQATAAPAGRVQVAMTDSVRLRNRAR
jgi:prepilin-type N-terminal cleavage/methylation domain-containing protein